MIRRFVFRSPAAGWAAAAALGAAACAGPAASAPPEAEFLIAAADSTYWVTSGARGIHLRGAPLTVAGAAGRFYELFVADDDRSFYDAVLVGQRLYRRDLLTGDSAVVFADSVVPRLATGYAAAHPAEYPLEVNEEPSDDPALVASAEVEIVSVHGPYATLEYHTDVEREGTEGRYVVRRGVVDWRTGHTAALSTLFGPAAARDMAAVGRQRFEAALDSVRRSADPRAADARTALRGFRFDEQSFSLASVGERPGVAFVAPGTGDDAGGTMLPLPIVPAPTVPAWWRDARAALADTPQGDAASLWRGDGYAVRAHQAGDSVATLTLVDGRRREWPVGRVQPSVSRVLWLDRPRVDAPTRRALQRAFDESALYDESARVAARAGRRAPPVGRVRLASAPGRRLAR